jgi:hypothetical protein
MTYVSAKGAWNSLDQLPDLKEFYLSSSLTEQNFVKRLAFKQEVNGN